MKRKESNFEPPVVVISSEATIGAEHRNAMADDIEYPTSDEVAKLYKEVVKVSGGEHGYLSRGNLDYILDAIKDIGERLDTKRAIVKKAAFLLYNLIVIHPFLNGNKRTSIELTRLFLRANGFDLRVGSKEAFDFLLLIASGKVSESDVESWLAKHLAEQRSE